MVKRFAVAAVAILFFSSVMTLLAWTNHDEEAERAAAESVVNLGAELRAANPSPTRDPLYGKPFAELCRDVGQGKEICR